MLKKIVVNSILLLTCLPLINAQELGLHFMESVWQSNKTNPAFMPGQKVIYAFPSFYGNFSHSAFSYNELLSTNAEGETVINGDHLVTLLDKQNYLRLQSDFETFAVGFKILNMQFSLQHAIRMNALVRYPRSLAQLAFEGNAPFIGKQVDIAPGFNLQAYNEIGLGFAMKLTKLTVGGRIKTLTGLANASSKNGSATLTTNDDIYQLHLNTDYLINTAGALEVNQTDDGVESDFNLDNYSPGKMLSLNRGWGIDLGARLEINEKLSVAASIVDLGYIRWSENVRNFKSQGDFGFDGFDGEQFISGDSIDFNSQLDTLLETFDFQETRNAFTTFLPAKVYLSGTYRFNPLFRAGALLYFENHPERLFPALALSGTVDLRKICSVGLVYSIHNRSYVNIGMNMQVKVGPVQVFGMSDNVVAAFRPADSRSTNVRLGLNLAFK